MGEQEREREAQSRQAGEGPGPERMMEDLGPDEPDLSTLRYRETMCSTPSLHPELYTV